MNTKSYITGAALTVAMAATALPAFAFTARNFMRVNPVSESVFEVVPRGPAQHGDYWCAAAEYLLFTGHSNATQRIYVVRGLGPAQTANRRSSVQFSVDAPVDVDTQPGLTLSVKRVGENLSAASARDQCYNSDFRLVP